MLYHHQWLCRKICAVVCLVVVGVTAYRYSDVNWINNKLLLEIRQQNSDLRHLLQGHNIQLPTRDSSPKHYVVRPVVIDTDPGSPAQSSLNHTTSTAADSTGYESNLDVDSNTSKGPIKTSVSSLPTYNNIQLSQRDKDNSDSDSDQFVTPLSTLESEFTMNGDFHRSSTPMSMLELKSRISTWTRTGKHGHLSNGLVTSTSASSELSVSTRRTRASYGSNYNLRSNSSNREASPASSSMSRTRRRPNKTIKKANVSPMSK